MIKTRYMFSKKETRYHTDGRFILKWISICLFTICLMGTGYAAYSNVLIHEYSIETGTMGFIFDDCETGRAIKAELQKSDKVPIELNAVASYDGKKLTISELGPLDIRDLSAGDVTIYLHYAVKTENQDQGLKQTAMIKGEEDDGYCLGEVDLQRNNQTPVWSIQSGDYLWGTAAEYAGSAPAAVYDFLPDRLCRFKVYHMLKPDEQEGIMNGTIILKQSSIPAIPDSVGLSSFDLPENIINEMKNGTSAINLMIDASYGFDIPISLDQFNVE